MRRDQSTTRARVGVPGGSEPWGAACHEGPSCTGPCALEVSGGICRFPSAAARGLLSDARG